MAHVAPGALINTAGSSNDFVGGQNGYGNVQFNGLPALSNAYIVDGLETNDPLTNLNSGLATNLVLGLNSIEEVTVNTTSYAVDQGRYGASQINCITKSGSNTPHGNLYELWNGSRLNAANFFTDATAGNRKPRSTVNHFGGSLSGPVRRDKLFFFGDFKQMRIALPIVNTVTLPSTAFQSYVLGQLPKGGVDTVSGTAYPAAPALVPFYTKMLRKRVRHSSHHIAIERRPRTGDYGAGRPEHRYRQHGVVPVAVGHGIAGGLHGPDQPAVRLHAWTEGPHQFKFGIGSRRLRIDDYDFSNYVTPLVEYTTLAQFIYGVASTATKAFPVAASQPFDYLIARLPGSFDAVSHNPDQPLNQALATGLKGVFSARANYTWSHCLDTVSNGGFLPFSAGGIISPLPGMLGRQYGNCDYDIRANFTASYVYELPVHVRSGVPFTVQSAPYSANGDGIVQGGGPQFASVRPGVPLYSHDPIPGITQPGTIQWLNPDAFVSTVDPSTGACAGGDSPRTCQIGNLGRKVLRGPEFFWTDLYLTKRLALTERLSLRLDGQFFNLLNHPNFALPAMIAGIPGKPDTQVGLGALTNTTSPPTGLLGVGLGGDNAPRMILVLGAALAASDDDQKAIRKGPAGRTSSSSGGEMYRAYCAACHGLGGKGDGPASSALKPAPTDLTQLAKRNSGKFPELQVFGAINGDVQVPAHGSKDMPVWGVVFRRMGDNSVSGATLRMRNLTRYIESLQQ